MLRFARAIASQLRALWTRRRDHQNVLRGLAGLLWQYRWRSLYLLVLQLGLTVLSLAGLAVAGWGIDWIAAAARQEATHLPQWVTAVIGSTRSPAFVICLIAAVVLAIGLLRSGLLYYYSVASTWLVQCQLVVELRAAVYDKLQRASFRFFDERSTGSLINRVTSDVQAVRLFLDGVLLQSVVIVGSLAIYLVYMVRIHVPLTIACLATTPLLWIFSVGFSRWVRPQYDRHRQLSDELMLSLTENIQGVQVVKGFCAEPSQRRRFEANSHAVTASQRRIFWAISLYTPAMGWLTQMNLLVLLGYGGYLVAVDALPLGTGLVVFHGLLQQFATQITNMASVANSVQQSLSGARRVLDILDAPEEVRSPALPKQLTTKQLANSASSDAGRSVRFDHLTFGYLPDRPVLKDISLSIEPGQWIAITGPTGAGKSTLLSLIPRFQDPQSGRVLLDDVDLRELDLACLRRQFGVMFQENFLFSHTVAANIAFGRPTASRDEIVRAATLSDAHGFISELPHGYDTVLSERGGNLSGGQRQRLALARALLSNPAVLLMDDPTASVDAQTEHELLSAIQQGTRGRTLITATHRVCMLKRADRIVVLEAGRITAVGTHAEVWETSPYYRHIASGEYQADHADALRSTHYGLELEARAA